MLRRRSFAPILLLLAGLAGCHLTGGMPVDLDPGRGRVDRTFIVGLGRAVRATLDALDDLEVAPKALTIRANDSASEQGGPKWQGQSNAEFLPDDASFRDLFEFQRMNVEGQGPIPFAPILVSYKGELRDGRDVVVVVRSLPPEARETRIMARIGRNGDEALGRKLIDDIAERLDRLPKSPDAQAASPAVTTGSTAPVTTGSGSVTPATAPADLPPLPPG